MASPQLIALRQRITELDGYFIVRKESYDLYTQEDQTKALAFRLLASAAVERYVEERCVAAARVGADRLKRRQPTISGRALVNWFIGRTSSRALLVYETDAEANVDLVEDALKAFVKSAKDSHGIAGKDFRRLALPVGLRDSQMSTSLTDSLDTFADVRNPASHTYVNRAKTLVEPVEEVLILEGLLAEFATFDAALDVVANSFPFISP